MTTQQEIILSCMESNLAKAKTKAMRDFCRKEIAGFKSRIQEQQKPKPTPPKAFLAFLED